ncbi:hypothetical protein D2A34_05375 [Clostridium chromiireducens]|uniref:Viral A-type inclusion protein n=1 Tax=Clostridium chromiireducens TaxID=225345 RepID=A0A399INW7_9CLOT|nr:hypothetical protein [Clostridium chromiireducens]RII34651.1 hypothetical protein D2A34_05375 [Clostridium chromiireducens]
MRFFKKDEVQQNEVQAVTETKIETKDNEKNVFSKRNLSLFNADTIEYIIENFPAMSIEIQSGLNNLVDILEHTIDYIEDMSSEIIKNDRDFKLSKAHRDTSIAIYDIVQNIEGYVKWMQHEYDKNIEEDKKNPNEVARTLEKDDIKNNQNNEVSLDSTLTYEEVEIYKDFSLKEPKAFKLGNKLINVDDWNDLLVKTAEVLTKQYKNNKNSNKFVKEINPVEKKSTQNSFRDTAIEMLTEYKINLDEFKIVIK